VAGKGVKILPDDTILLREKLIAEIQAHFGVGANFAQAYLDYWQLGYTRTFAGLDEILALPAPQSTWFSYALSANRRGEQTLQMATPYLPRHAHRYLDIGCGYGGALVAFSQLGMEVRGIEIDERLIQLGKVNCLDHSLEDCILDASILDDDLVNHLGTFDVITLLSVIEHVSDVIQTLQNAAQLLAPGGILIIECPNKDSLSFVAHDPHYHLFGLTLLASPRDFEYFRHFYNVDYGIGELHELGFYMDQLARQGCQCRLIAPPRRLIWGPFLLIRLFAGYVEFLFEKRKTLSTSLAAEIQVQFRRYLSTLIKDFFHLPLRTANERSFQVKYLTSAWTLMAIKEQQLS
jgi:2-polyprenyl-3-methyl-5-hydroxy-6-metoxy-1,4-benzoquinol methylase